MLYGHMDVVTTQNQTWTHPPFSGLIKEGYVWGRGTLDMKGPLAMMLAAFLRAKVEGTPLPYDVLFVALADEEHGGQFGAEFLVEKHQNLFQGVRYALGEFGGFPLFLDKHTFYPIMVAEKQACWTRFKVRGPGGHGSMPVSKGAMRKLARLLERLHHPLPAHVTPVAFAMLEAIACELSFPKRCLFRLLLKERYTNTVLKLLGPKGRVFSSILHHTISPTGLMASEKVNVIPSEITLDADVRILPGFTPEDFLHELKERLGDASIEISFVRRSTGKTKVDTSKLPVLGEIVKELDPQAKPIPYVLPGVTDGRFFATLGIQTYGFTPMNLPPDLDFTAIIHAANERIPVECVHFGSEAIFQAMQRIT